VNLLDWALRGAYEVRDEVPVGRLPPQVDILILRRFGEPSEIARRELEVLLRILNEVTLLEFKGPTDALGPGDFAYFLGCVCLFHSQQHPGLPRGTITMAIIAPSLTAPFREDAERLGFTMHERSAGVWEIAGGPFPFWLLETDRLTEHEETALALFSRTFLRDPQRIIEHWRETPHAGVLRFVVQQIVQFNRLGETFSMQHTETFEMDRTLDEVIESALKSMTPDRLARLVSRAALLEGIPPEKLLENVPPEKLLENIPPETLVHAVTPEEMVRSLDRKGLEQLRQLVNKRLKSEEARPDDHGDAE
jgi:hypothetical protein